MPKDTTPASLLLQTIGPPLSPWHESFPYKKKKKNVCEHQNGNVSMSIVLTGLDAQNIVDES